MKCLIFNFLNWLFSRIGIPLDDIFVTHVWVECRVSRTGYGVPDDNADLAHSRWKTRDCLEIESFWSRWKRFPTSEAIPWTPSMVHLWDYFWTARKNFHRKGAHEKSRKYWMLLVPRNPQNQTEKKGWKNRNVKKRRNSQQMQLIIIHRRPTSSFHSFAQAPVQVGTMDTPTPTVIYEQHTRRLDAAASNRRCSQRAPLLHGQPTAVRE